MGLLQIYGPDGQLAEQWSNATRPTDPTPAGYTAFNADGTVSTSRALTAPEVAQLAAADAASVAVANKATISAQALTALTANTTYLAIATPTQAQAVAQVTALTRQNNRIIRLLLNQLDATT